MGVIRDLFTMTGIPQDTRVSFPGDLETMQQPGSDVSKMTQQAGVNTSPFSSRVSIEVDEDYEMDRVLSTAINRVEYPFIFADYETEVGLRPVYSSTDTTINFKYRSVDKTEATRWRDNIRRLVAMNLDQRIHRLEYHYLIPMECLMILKEIHKLTETVAGHGIDFNQYMEKYLCTRATIMTTQAGTQAAWAINEAQVKVVGTFDFELVPEKGSKEDEADTWTVVFAYKYKYDKPIAVTMKYPLMIHNQLLPQNVRNNPLTDKLDPLEDKQFDFSISSWLFYQLQSDVLTKRAWDANGWKGIAIPFYDEFVPNNVLANSDRVFTALINIDESNPHLLLSLKELGAFSINPVVLKFMLGEYKYMTDKNMSPFTLSMYRGSKLLDDDSIQVDENLNVYATYILTLRKYYHIRLGVATDFTKLSDAAILRLRDNGEACRIIMDYINPNLKKKHLLPAILGNDYITKIEFNKALKAMNQITGKDPLMMTIQSLIVSAGTLNDIVNR